MENLNIMAVIVFVLISSFCLNTARAFLFQLSQQTTLNVQNLEFLMKSLLSLSNNEGMMYFFFLVVSIL